jgi:hypothetical protein
LASPLAANSASASPPPNWGFSLGTPDRRYRMLAAMEISVDMARSPGGQLTGTVQRAGSGERGGFHGVMELLACLERLVDTGAPPNPHPTLTKENRP